MPETVGHEETTLPSTPQAGGAVAYNTISKETQPPPLEIANGGIILPAGSRIQGSTGRLAALELEDGTVYQGYNFGAEKSVAGELVFQTGMVGYPESITDPSYRGQILVITFPLVGNYGVASREVMDELLKTLPKYFESSQVHIAALVVATYAGENYSHFLAESSLGQWLKEQGVPALHGVDTRALTKRMRQKGSMLGRMVLHKSEAAEMDATMTLENWKSSFEQIDWVDPNTKNLVHEGTCDFLKDPRAVLTLNLSIDPRTPALFSAGERRPEAPLRTSRPRSLLGCWSEVQSAAMLARPRCRGSCCSMGL